MAYPVYGTAGTELLYRTTINGLSTSATAFRWDRTNATTGTTSYVVAAHHIVTVLSILLCNNDATVQSFNMHINDGSNDIYIFNQQGIGGHDTFAFSDRLCLVAGDKLQIVFTGSNMECHCTYIDQNNA